MKRPTMRSSNARADGLGRTLGLAAALFFGGPVAAGAQAAVSLERTGELALDVQDFGTAMEAFLLGLEDALERGDTEAGARFSFYLGLTAQQQALDLAPDPDHPLRAEFFLEAVRRYAEALELKPDWAPALNNLAELQHSRGDDTRAQELYRRIIREDVKAAVSIDEFGFYAKNYADLLVETAGWEEASLYYEEAARAQPDDRDLQRLLIELYVENDPDRVGEHLWHLVESRRVNLAIEWALRALGMADWNQRHKVELLTIVVQSLSEKSHDRRQYLDPSSPEIGPFLDDEDVAEGAAELVALRAGESLDPDGFRWWAQRGQFAEDPERGVWPRDAFRALIRSLGRGARQREEVDQAEGYYRLAANLSPQDPDPEAFLELVELYVDMDRLEELEELASSYVPQLFAGKEGEYRAARYESIYRYHRALGATYFHLERWGDSSSPTSAIFQLEYAVRAAEVHNRQLAGQEEGDILLKPRLLSRLARAYERGEQRPSGDVVQAVLTLVETSLDRGQTEQGMGLGEVLLTWPLRPRPMERLRRLLAIA